MGAYSKPQFWRAWEDPGNNCCGKKFKKKRELIRHSQATILHDHQKEKCIDCGQKFTRKDNLTRHRKMKHESDEKPECKYCKKLLSRKDAVQRHEGTCHGNPKRHPSPTTFRNKNPHLDSYEETDEARTIIRPIPMHPGRYYYYRSE